MSSRRNCNYKTPPHHLAEEDQVKRIDLMSQLIKHLQATFMLRVSGDSMCDASIMTAQ